MQKTTRRLRRLQRQVKSRHQEARAQRRLVAGVERRFLRLKARALHTGIRRARPAAHAAVDPVPRERLSMRGVRFAKLAAVSPGSIFGWETGRTLPRGRSVARLREVQKMGVRTARGKAGRWRRNRRRAGGRTKRAA